MYRHPLSASAKLAKQKSSTITTSKPIINGQSNIVRSLPQTITPFQSPVSSKSSVTTTQQINTLVSSVNKATPTPRINNILVLGPAALYTHFFDGKMADNIAHIKPDIDRVRFIPATSKARAFEQLLKKMYTIQNVKLTPNALKCFNAISFSICEGANYDPTNKLHAEDLLYLLYEKIVIEDSHEHASFLAEQLNDMISGLCPQGRTTRLLQILIMLKDDLTPTSKPHVENSTYRLSGNIHETAEFTEVVVG